MSEVSREQEYIGRLYERVDGLRDGVSARLGVLHVGAPPAEVAAWPRARRRRGLRASSGADGG